MTAEDLDLHTELVGTQIHDAFQLYLAGDVDGADATLSLLCSGCHQTLAVACTMATVLTDTYRAHHPGEGPMGATVFPLTSEEIPADQLAAAELMAAIIAAVGNDDHHGAHMVWHKHTQDVCEIATANLFIAAASLLRPVDGGGSE